MCFHMLLDLQPPGSCHWVLQDILLIKSYHIDGKKGIYDFKPISIVLS